MLEDLDDALTCYIRGGIKVSGTGLGPTKRSRQHHKRRWKDWGTGMYAWIPWDGTDEVLTRKSTKLGKSNRRILHLPVQDRFRAPISSCLSSHLIALPFLPLPPYLFPQTQLAPSITESLDMTWMQEQSLWRNNSANPTSQPTWISPFLSPLLFDSRIMLHGKRRKRDLDETTFGIMLQ